MHAISTSIIILSMNYNADPESTHPVVESGTDHKL